MVGDVAAFAVSFDALDADIFIEQGLWEFRDAFCQKLIEALPCVVFGDRETFYTVTGFLFYFDLV